MIVLPDNLPAAVAALPRDSRGYPIPWFVSIINGQPEFRVADSEKLIDAIQQKRCWICGTPLDPRQHVFVLGPLSTISRVSGEPPSHADCAVAAAQICPFLTKPKAVRREAGMPESTAPGFMVDRNPGVTCLWYCKGYTYAAKDGGVLFNLPNPAYVRWWAEGRQATAAEVLESFESGIPIFEALVQDGPDWEREELRRAIQTARQWLPKS